MNAATAKRIVIVGGGVIGLSAAYHLAKLGEANVVLLEKQAVGDGSSSRAGGIITWSLVDGDRSRSAQDQSPSLS